MSWPPRVRETGLARPASKRTDGFDRMNDNIAHRQIVYRLLPGSQAKAGRLAGQAGACRFVWNEMLARQKAACEAARQAGGKPPSVTFFSLGRRFTELRSETEWLQGYSFKITRYALKHQADAWTAAFGGGGLPKFKSRHRSAPSFTIPENVKLRDGKLHVPKIGWLRVRRKGGNPHPDGVPRQAVVRKDAGKWYVTVCCEIEAPEIEDNGAAAGVDMNVRQVAVAMGDGAEIIDAPDASLLETRLKRNQRRLSRQRKGSRRRMRTKLRIQKLHRRIAGTRRNWQHHASRQIAGRASTVAVEKLNTRGMTKSAKGTAEAPGANVRAKSGLNREILRTGWHGLKAMLSYKCRELIEVDPAYTSQACSSCGAVDKANRKGREFKCVACGHADHADLNAARNILASGIGASARRGALAPATPATREIDALAA